MGYPKHDAGKTTLVKWNVTKVRSRVLTHGSQMLVRIKLCLLNTRAASVLLCIISYACDEV